MLPVQAGGGQEHGAAAPVLLPAARAGASLLAATRKKGRRPAGRRAAGAPPGCWHKIDSSSPSSKKTRRTSPESTEVMQRCPLIWSTCGRAPCYGRHDRLSHRCLALAWQHAGPPCGPPGPQCPWGSQIAAKKAGAEVGRGPERKQPLVGRRERRHNLRLPGSGSRRVWPLRACLVEADVHRVCRRLREVEGVGGQEGSSVDKHLRCSRDGRAGGSEPDVCLGACAQAVLPDQLQEQ